MRVRTLLLSAGFLAAIGAVATSQPKLAPLVPTPNPPGAGVPTPPSVTPPVVPPLTVPTPPPPPPEKTVEDLIKELEHIQVQKAALEMQEKGLKAALGKKLEAQHERLKKLGVTPKQPDHVGRIIIEGNTQTPDQKILDMLKLLPGQVLHYPALDVARARLEKAGFRDVTVEAVVSDPDSNFKDIRVKLAEPKPAPAPEPTPVIRG